METEYKFRCIFLKLRLFFKLPISLLSGNGSLRNNWNVSLLCLYNKIMQLIMQCTEQHTSCKLTKDADESNKKIIVKAIKRLKQHCLNYVVFKVSVVKHFYRK